MNSRIGIALVGAAALAVGVVVCVQRSGRGAREAAVRGVAEAGADREPRGIEGPAGPEHEGTRLVETPEGEGEGEASPVPAEGPVETGAREAIPVEVRAPGGSPAAEGVEVLFALHDGDPAQGDYRPARTGSRSTDARGRAWLAVAEEDRVHPWLEVWAREAGRGLVSDTRVLQAPWPSGDDDPIVLELRPAGSLRVRVFDASLVAAGGAEVRVFWAPSLGWLTRQSYWRGKADGDGVFVLSALRPGEYEIHAGDERVGRSAQGRVQVDRGEEAVLELVLSESELPLAVEGRLVDEEGRPLADAQVGVRLDDAEDEWWVRTDRDGRFAWYAEPGARVRVRARPDDPCERFEPEEAVVAFGERDVVLRRSAVLAEVTASFRVLDEATGEPVAGAQAWVVYDQAYDERHGPPSGEDGVATVNLCLREGTEWGIHAPGYLEKEGSLTKAETNEPLRVVLRRGFDRWVQVVDWYTGDPLPGAVVTDGAGILAVADEKGLVHLVGRVWPERLDVTCVGYRATFWEPARRLSWREDFVGLLPLEEGK